METPDSPQGQPESHDSALEDATDESLPSDAPPIRALRRVWKDYQAEIATEQDLATVLQAVSDLTMLQLDTLQAQVERGESDPEDSSYKFISQAFRDILEAVDIMFQELEEPEHGHFEAGFEMAEQACRRLLEGHGNLMQTIEAMGNVNCIFCGGVNPRGVERCGRCGRNLPTQPGDPENSSFTAVQAEAGTPDGGQGEVTQNFLHIESNFQAWRSGDLDDAGMLEAIETVELRLATHHRQNETDRIQIGKAPADARAALSQAVDHTGAALQQNQSALERFKLAFQKEDEVNLELAFDDLRQAAFAMVAAFYVAKAAGKTPAS